MILIHVIMKEMMMKDWILSKFILNDGKMKQQMETIAIENLREG